MTGILYVVATPIGNLSDISERALDALRNAHVIACEDTRVTRTLLARFGTDRPTVALHEHNEREAASALLRRLRAGESVALVSDAGTPGLSDPGAWLVAQAYEAGARVTPIPGPSAAAAAISVCGFSAAQFHFAGFLPASAPARRKALRMLDLPVPLVIYEAPHRIAATLADLHECFGPQRQVLIARELSKKFEETARLPLGETAAWLAGAAHREQGEFVLVLAAGEARPVRPSLDGETVLDLLLGALPPSEAARLAARITGEPKNALYQKALERQARPRK